MNKKITSKSVITDEYVLKKNNKDLRSLFDYLDKRGFNNYPEILEIDEKQIKTRFIADEKSIYNQKEKELIDIVSDLHNKTLFNKDVSKNKYKEIYEKIKNNIEYSLNYYNKLISKIEKKIYFSPSEYLLARNFSIILESLKFSSNTLDEWFKLVENKKKERVVINHNNLKIEHLLMNDRSYLVNWDNYLVDTPILDIYKFYINEGKNFDFEELIDLYNKKFNLLEEERKLLYILMSLPKKIEFLDNEFLSTYNIKKILDFSFKTRDIINNLEFKVYESKTEN